MPIAGSAPRANVLGPTVATASALLFHPTSRAAGYRAPPTSSSSASHNALPWLVHSAPEPPSSVSRSIPRRSCCSAALLPPWLASRRCPRKSKLLIRAQAALTRERRPSISALDRCPSMRPCRSAATFPCAMPLVPRNCPTWAAALLSPSAWPAPSRRVSCPAMSAISASGGLLLYLWPLFCHRATMPQECRRLGLPLGHRCICPPLFPSLAFLIARPRSRGSFHLPTHRRPLLLLTMRAPRSRCCLQLRATPPPLGCHAVSHVPVPLPLPFPHLQRSWCATVAHPSCVRTSTRGPHGHAGPPPWRYPRQPLRHRLLPIIGKLFPWPADGLLVGALFCGRSQGEKSK